MDDIVKIIIELFGAIVGSGSILCIYVSHRLNNAEKKLEDIEANRIVEIDEK